MTAGETAPLLTPEQTYARLLHIHDHVPHLAFDTEGQEWMTCLGFAWSPEDVLVIDTLGLRGKPWSGSIWGLVVAILESPRIHKVAWNAAHERGFLQWCHGITLRNYDDAMDKFAERWPELPKRLKYVASLLTRLPCWTEGISWSEDNDETRAEGERLWTYNGYDDVATYLIDAHPQLALTGTAQERYRFHLALIEPLNYASQKGIAYDQARAAQLKAQLETQAWEAQATVDQLAGLRLPQLIHWARDHCCVKRDRLKVTTLAAAQRYALKSFRDGLGRVRELCHSRQQLGPAGRAEIAALLGCGLNVKSTPAVTACLNRLGLPPVFKRGVKKVSPDAPDVETAPSQSKDQEALLKLFLRTGHPITTAILRVVALRGRLQELNRGLSKDGRIRCCFLPGYGTETGRTTSHKWLDGAGGNLQTVPKDPVNFRVLYHADPRHLWWKLDLTGADLWTVACRVASLGDRTMLEDLLAGIRIPSLVGLLMEGYRTEGRDRATIKADCKAYRARLKASGEGWKDTLWKKASHLTNYGGKPPRIRQGVIEDSYAETGTPVDPGLSLCQQVQRLYLQRYWGLPKWWSDVAVKIMRTGCLEMATGAVREFIGRRPRNGVLDDETRREALAAEPQQVTTYACNLALHTLWHDPEVWPSGEVGVGEPRIQPLLSVHDELAGQCLTGDRDFLATKLRAAFNRELTIGRIMIKIPWEGATGPNWGECKDMIA